MTAKAQEVLDSPTGRKLFELVNARPGRSMNELKREAGLATGVFYHYLRRLEREGHVHVTPQRPGERTRRVYPKATRIQDQEPFHGSTRRAIAEAILVHGPLPARAIADATKLSRRVVYHHLKKLIDAGLVTRGNHGVIHASADLHRLT